MMCGTWDWLQGDLFPSNCHPTDSRSLSILRRREASSDVSHSTPVNPDTLAQTGDEPRRVADAWRSPGVRDRAGCIRALADRRSAEEGNREPGGGVRRTGEFRTLSRHAGSDAVD